MKDFNEYSKNSTTNDNAPDGNIFNLVNSLASKFDGKNQTELLEEIYKKAKENKQNGTLTNQDIDNFVNTLSPFLDDKKKKILDKLAIKLKGI